MDTIITFSYKVPESSPSDAFEEASRIARENTPRNWELVGCTLGDESYVAPAALLKQLVSSSSQHQVT